MDNGSVTSNSTEELLWAYEQLPLIFSPFGFGLQQFSSNDEVVEEKIRSENHEGMKNSEENTIELFWNYLEQIRRPSSYEKEEIESGGEHETVDLEVYC